MREHDIVIDAVLELELLIAHGEGGGIDIPRDGVAVAGMLEVVGERDDHGIEERHGYQAPFWFWEFAP